MTRLRVLLVSPEWPRADGEHVGGVGRWAHRFATELAPLVDLTVATLSGPLPVDGVRFIDLGRPASRWARYYGLPFRLRRVIDTRDYDLVHSLGDEWALRLRGRPLVRTFLGSSWREAVTSRGLRRANHVVLAGLEHLGARRAALRIAIGADSLAEFRCDRIMPPVTAVGRPDLPRTAEPSFVFIGSHGGRKRGALAEAAVAAATAATGRRIDLHVVGPASDAANWGAAVTHHAGLDDTAVQRLVAASWGLLAPSEYEGFGIPVFEAAALGVPAVATPNPGSSWIAARFAGTGAVEIVEPDGLAAAVERLVGAAPIDATGAAAVVADLVREGRATTVVDEVYRPLTAR